MTLKTMRFFPILLALLCTTHLTAQDPTNTTQRIYLSGTDAELQDHGGLDATRSAATRSST